MDTSFFIKKRKLCPTWCKSGLLIYQIYSLFIYTAYPYFYI